jgi:hypothetical protein
MIQEIGIVVALYVLTRLIPQGRPRLVATLGTIAGVVTFVVLVDLSLRSVTSNGIVAVFTGSAATSTAAPQSPPPAQNQDSAKPSFTVTRTEGGSITTQLGFGIAVAKNSSLKREWITVHHPIMPADLEGTPGINTVFVRNNLNGEYRYRAEFKVNVKEPARAVRVNFLAFDVWGNHVRTLNFEEVSDLPTGVTDFVGQWNLFSENDVEKHYASIGYVAKVRLADGRVVDAPTDGVLDEARKFSSKFTAAELEPQSAPSTQPAASR